MNCSKHICAQMQYLYGFRANAFWPSIAFINGFFVQAALIICKIPKNC